MKEWRYNHFNQKGNRKKIFKQRIKYRQKPRANTQSTICCRTSVTSLLFVVIKIIVLKLLCVVIRLIVEKWKTFSNLSLRWKFYKSYWYWLLNILMLYMYYTLFYTIFQSRWLKFSYFNDHSVSLNWTNKIETLCSRGV